MSITTLSDRESLETIGAAAGSLLGSSSGELVLRMTNGPHAGRIVRLSSSKCSIGSAADCTLRLRGAGLNPVHCVILRGSRQTIIRRWSGDTRLNDRGFDDMPLQHGDRLTVGSIEMQVVAVPSEVREVAQAARRLDLELAAATGRLERLTERLDLANRQGRRRLRLVLAKLRKYQLRLTEVESRRSRLSEEQESLAAERAQLQAGRQTLDDQQAELRQEARRLAECEGNIAAQRTELERRATMLLEREAELTARGRELTDRTTAFAAEQVRLQTARAELEQHQTTQFRESRRLAAIEADVAARQAECQQRSAALNAQAAELTRREQALQSRAAQLADGEQTLAAREAALNAQIEELHKQAVELTCHEADLECRAAELARRDTDLAGRESDLTSREQRLADREQVVIDREQGVTDRDQGLAGRESSLAQHESEIAARCEALKNHWTVLTERETKLERDRTALVELRVKVERDQIALAELQAKLELDCNELTKREHELASRPAPTPMIEKVIETKTVVDTAAVERAEQLQRALDEARAELAALQAEQARREAKLQSNLSELQAEQTRREAGLQADLAELQAEHARRETKLQGDLAELQASQAALESAQAAEKLDLEDRRAAVEAEAADLMARRATVELAARTVAKWSALVEEWSAAAPASIAAPVDETPDSEPAAPIVNPVNEEIAAALDQAERRLLDDQLEIEKLEAELKTWRDEAKLWKSRFDEASIAPPPQAAAVMQAEEAAEPVSELPEEPVAESDAIVESLADESAADETADASSYESTIEHEAEAEYKSIAAEVPSAEAVAEQPQAETPAAHEAKSESAADVLRRLGLSAALEDEPSPTATQQPVRPTPPPAPAPKPAAAEHHEGEESLDAYMQQLFQRLGVNQGAASAPAAAAKPQPSPSQTMATPRHAEEAQQAEKPAAPAAALPLLQPGEFKARSSAAERRSDLSALRELANFQAKTAITKNQIARSASKSKGKQTLGLLSLAMALYCGFAYFVQGTDHALYGMATGIGIAALQLIQSLRLKLKASKSARSLDDVIQKTAERGATVEVRAQ